MRIVALVVSAAVLSVAACIGWRVSSNMVQAAGDRVVQVDWTPPSTTIDPGYVAAARALLGNGLGDPRGRPFRLVKTADSSESYGRVAAPAQYGWVSPDGRSAVMIDGIERPITGPGTPATLDEAIGKLTAKPARPSFMGDPYAATPAELLMVGRVDLAQQVDASVDRGRTGDSRGYALFTEVELLLNWEAATAMQSLDDARGRQVSGRLVAAYTLQQNLGILPRLPQNDRLAESLKSAKSIYEDFDRRVVHPETAPVDLPAIKSLSKPNRIEKLVAALDTIKDVAVADPGGVSYMSDPICSAIAAEGNDAVPALIDTIDRDRRLTRVVVPGRSFNSAFAFCPVKGAAWQVLLNIWPSSTRYAQAGMVPFPPAPPAPVLREAWAKDSRLTEPERFLNVLGDDSIDWRLWSRAARFLVKPEDEKWTGLGYSYTPSRDPKAPMTAEPLRAQRGAEITQLLSRRALELSSASTGNSMDAFRCGDGLSIADCLYKWAPNEALEVLRRSCANCLDGLHRYGTYVNANNTVAGPFGSVISDRIALGDRSAISDYDAIMPSIQFSSFGFPRGFLKPLWAHPRDPQTLSAGERLMGVLGLRIDSPESRDSFSAIQFVARQPWNSPVLVFRPYRDLLIKYLKDDRILGEGTVEPGGPFLDLPYRFQGGPQGAWQLRDSESKRAHVGMDIRYSLSDVLALELGYGFLKGFPEFSIEAAEPERTRQKNRLIRFLNNDDFDWMAFSRSSPFVEQGE